ncbi:DUF2189 domain-containing protein [Ramlibacter rhizophilus]|uniref:DUF2189 domain-containing protein n=1 Tax=Ramlibacter rhizophilus TaxID=1781167 RepID=A0A4Z0C1S6_9BURK|nr:DUF2189 domain-containing protein [Ramlibacter rhizophilus]TFZ04892.1 DUF2189 domain-containing protein [Ramlibacter rhizophilus]
MNPPSHAVRPDAALPHLSPADPFRWLVRGARDLGAAPGISFFYGLCFWGMAALLGAIFRNAPEYTMSFICGCFLVGPFLAMGLYEVSRRRELGLPQDFAASLTYWDRHLGSMGLLVLVMALLELLWGRASLVIFAVFFDTGMPTTATVLQAVFDPANAAFVAAYLAVGGFFAALVFASCVITIPMILDRDTDAISAALASLRVVVGRPGVMLLWGALIVGLVLGAFLLPWALGLLLVGPWLGHASWHALRGCTGPAPAVQPLRPEADEPSPA